MQINKVRPWEVSLLLLFCLFSVSSQGQSVPEQIVNIRYFSSRSDITNERTFGDYTIFDVTQDQRGLIWMATSNGIYSFDGYSFSPIEPKGNPFHNKPTKKFTRVNSQHIIVEGNDNLLGYLNTRARKIDSILPAPPVSIIDKFFVYFAPDKVEQRLYLSRTTNKLIKADGKEFKASAGFEVKSSSHLQATPWSTILLNTPNEKSVLEVDYSGKVLHEYPDYHIYPNKLIFFPNAPSTHDYLMISVKNSGVGISPQQQEKLFQLAPEKRRSGTMGEKSTGLGLLLCYELLKMNQGKISVESEAGKGSTFTVQLPLSEK